MVQQLHLPRGGQRPLLLELLPLHAGRITGYALLGAAAGAAGVVPFSPCRRPAMPTHPLGAWP